MDLTYKDEVVGIIRQATHEDCLIVGSNLRIREMQEIWGYDNSLPVEGVTNSFNKSVVSMTILHDDKPVAIFGIMILKEVPTLWLMPTNDLEKIGRNFVRNTKEWINKMLEEYPTLVAYVHWANDESLQWMNFVGGRQIEKVFMGKDNSPFWKFEFKKNKELATRNVILDIQAKMEKDPRALWGNAFPLKHSFAEGLYIREVFLPKGYVIVTRIFKKSHATFMLLGDCSVLTERGVLRVKAPMHMVTAVGTKRVIYTHEDTVWITCHANPDNIRDIEELERIHATNDYKDLDAEESKFMEAFVTEVVR